MTKGLKEFGLGVLTFGEKFTPHSVFKTPHSIHSVRKLVTGFAKAALMA